MTKFLGFCAAWLYTLFTALTLLAGDWRFWVTATAWMIGTFMVLDGLGLLIKLAVKRFARR